MKKSATILAAFFVLGIFGVRARAQGASATPEAGAVCADQSLDSAAAFIDQIKALSRAQAKTEATVSTAHLVRADDDNGWQNIGGGCWQKQDPNMPPGCYKKCCPYPSITTYPCLKWVECAGYWCITHPSHCAEYDYQHPIVTPSQPGLSCVPTC